MYAALLAAVFIAWWRTERNLSVHAVASTRRELFYWAAVAGAFALGTAGLAHARHPSRRIW